MKRITIIIADDHTLFVDGLYQLLVGEQELDILSITKNGKELLDLLKLKTPDIVLLDINMPIINGLEAAKFINHLKPQIKIIFLSTYNDEHLIEKAKSVGAKGYLLKDSSKVELLESIHKVFRGENSFPSVKKKSNNEFNKLDGFLKQFNLTSREYEVIQLIKNDMTNQEIADKINRSIYTVETHRKNIMQKLGFHKPSELLKFIIENNI